MLKMEGLQLNRRGFRKTKEWECYKLLKASLRVGLDNDGGLSKMFGYILTL